MARQLKRVTKKHRLAMASASKRVQERLLQCGAVEIERRESGFHPVFEVQTPLGLLQVTICDEPEFVTIGQRACFAVMQRACFAVMQRFEDYDRAAVILGRRNNGKWNFHFSDDDDQLLSSNGLDYWLLPFNRIMEHSFVPPPEGRHEIVIRSTGQVIVNRMTLDEARAEIELLASRSDEDCELAPEFPVEREAYEVRPMANPCDRSVSRLNIWLTIAGRKAEKERHVARQ